MRLSIITSSLIAIFAANNLYAYDLSVSAGNQNQVISNSKTYSIPKGTNSVTLLYNIYSAEYPTYVTSQSVYNDVWSLSVSGPSGVLFDITRQVNSQLTQFPTWQPDSTTGEITQNIDVSNIVKNGDAELQLIATSMNVGDSALTTTVSASLQAPPALTIDNATPDAINANNGGTHYSIPDSGDSNTLQRYFTLSVTKTSEITLKNITVTAAGSGGDMMDVVQNLAVPSNSDVQINSQTATKASIKVRVTVRDPSSTVGTAPPPTRDLSYRFKLEGQDSKGNTVIAEKTISGRRALWRMVDALPSRYGSRDAGHDDWGAQGTYNWLQTNSALINEVDDISGEHGRNIGHATHQFGTDIDTYHFYKFATGVSGTQNYELLKSAVLSAFATLLPNGQSNPTPPQSAINSRNAVIAWINSTRTGLNNLALLGSVEHLYYAIGSAGSGLSNGWARSLITTGTVTLTSTVTINNTPTSITRTLNLNTGVWNNNKVTFNSVHNNHVHVTLNRPSIGE